MNAACAGGATALYLACANGHAAAVRELLMAENIDVNRYPPSRAHWGRGMGTAPCLRWARCASSPCGTGGGALIRR